MRQLRLTERTTAAKRMRRNGWALVGPDRCLVRSLYFRVVGARKKPPHSGATAAAVFVATLERQVVQLLNRFSAPREYCDFKQKLINSQAAGQIAMVTQLDC
jgi:hypothetical protein